MQSRSPVVGGQPSSALEVSFHRFTKRIPLTISRGTSTHTTVGWLRWKQEEVEGWGEMVPVIIDEHPQTPEVLQAAAEAARPWLESSSAWERVAIERRLRAEGAPSAFIAAINLALYDWLGKRTGQPVWRLLGLREDEGPLTSVTIGLQSPEAAVKRVQQWLELGDVRAFKVKLGSPAGADADREMFTAVQTAVPRGCRISVDANGGWSADTAITMAAWLAERGVDHLEQPLARGAEAELSRVHAASPVPILVDESCRNSGELVRLIGSIDGFNIKLMKCGGLDEALRLIAIARAYGLRVLIGCYGNTALGNTAAAQLGAWADYLDLDSHLNLADDPFRGAELCEGRLKLTHAPGFGVT